MPRIPLIAPEPQGVSLPPQPSLDPGYVARLTTSGTRMAGQALGQVAGAAQDIYAEQQRIQKTLTEEQDKLAAEQAINQFKLGSATYDTALKADMSVPAYAYAERMDEYNRKQREQIGRGLKSPGARLRFERAVDGVQTEMAINAQHEGLKLQTESIRAGAMTAQEADEKAASLTDDPQQRAFYTNKIYERNQLLLGKKILTGLEVDARDRGARERIARGVTERIFETGSGAQRNQAIADLRAGRTDIPQTEAFTLARELETRERAEEQRRKAEAKAEREDRAKEADKTVTDLVFANNFAGARQTLKDAQSDMDPTRYEHWTKAIEEREKKGTVTVSDPAVLRRLIPMVYSTTTDPRVANNAVLEAYGNQTLADDDMRTFSGHLETKINRLATQANAAAVRADAKARQDEARWNRDANQVESELKGLTRVDASLSPTLNLQAQDVYNQAVQDMYRPGSTERPREWMERNRTKILGQVQQNGKARVSNITKELNFSDRAAQGDTPQAIDRGRQILQGELRAARSPRERDAVMDRIRLLNEKEDVLHEMNRFGSATRPPTTAPAPGGGTAPAAPTPAAPTGPRRAPGT